jgi:hypothetical protein
MKTSKPNFNKYKYLNVYEDDGFRMSSRKNKTANEPFQLR